MKINVYFEIDESLITFDYKTIIKTLEKSFKNKFKTKGKASLIFVNNERIHEINKQYRSIDRPTDIISFEEHDEKGYIGEMFISIDKLYEQASLYGHTNEREMAFLLCHGLLHLHGYDHMTLEDEKIMFALQDEILDKTIYKR